MDLKEENFQTMVGNNPYIWVKKRVESNEIHDSYDLLLVATGDAVLYGYFGGKEKKIDGRVNIYDLVAIFQYVQRIRTANSCLRDNKVFLDDSFQITASWQRIEGLLEGMNQEAKTLLIALRKRLDLIAHQILWGK